MFGESESESPRVPSPWDSLISLPPSPKPSTPSPLSSDLSPSTKSISIPRLVPESDVGNVEYKLQLLSPSPARFARLVTQLKWRLLEGGGQAYYELGVSDSGDLIGLQREDLERTLETLEMMAGEIGASVFVVKEIEVPFGMVELVARREGKKRGKGEDEDTDTGQTETETESPSDTDGDDLSATVVLERDALFAMDLESDLDEPNSQSRFAIDLEIASVFKPRPVRTRVHNHLHVAGTGGGKNKKVKKPKHLMPALNGNEGSGLGNGDATEHNKTHHRRQARDRKREEKRRALTAFAAQSVSVAAASAVDSDSSAIVLGLEQMHVTIEEPAMLTVPFDGVDISSTGIEISSQTILAVDVSLEIQHDEDGDDDDDDDVFAPPTTATPYSTFPTAPGGESFLNVPATAFPITTFSSSSPTSSGAGSIMNGGKAEKGETRLIVEVLVVRKMSLEEAFLDFGGFSLT
ncbi:hypothetical protein K443DRAFT_598746 [Laccaria amethystina LaAM-08-1]|uniref:GTP-binding protein 2 n=1 Tax=Laccaria amethystina LaAM-08-1 TaxID=1095629 RepID=A0A0C9XSD3_9AGAR|nr:hypothetical protein K443DRAFT_598746 [Laccaria amethystina LaAM-08-1]